MNLEDGWYRVRNTNKPRLQPAILQIRNGKHLAGGVDVALNQKLGFTYERVVVLTLKETQEVLSGQRMV